MGRKSTMAMQASRPFGTDKGFKRWTAQVSSFWWRLQPGATGTQARAEYALQRALGDQAASIRVEVFGGFIELHGKVLSTAVSSEAERIAKQDARSQAHTTS